MASECTLVAVQQCRVKRDVAFHVLAAIATAAVLAAALLNLEVTPGVLIDDILLLSGGLIGGLLLASRHGGPWRVHWAGMLMLAAAALATFWSWTVTDGIQTDSMRGIVKVWWLRIAVLGSVTLMIAARPKLTSFICGVAFYCILINLALIVAMVIATGEEGVLRQSPTLQGLLPDVIIRNTSFERANSVMRRIVLLLPFAMWHARRGVWKLPMILMAAGIVIALTRSRVGLAVYSVEAIIAFCFVAKGIAPRLLTGLMLIAMLTVVTAQVSRRLTIVARTQQADAGPRVREALFQGVLELVSERPIAGWGIGSAAEEVNRVPKVVQARQTHTGHEYIAVHSNFMLYAIESGVVTAALALMFFLAVIGAVLMAVIRHRTHLRAWFILLSVSALAGLMVMQTATVLRDNVLWIAMGVIITSLAGVGLPQRVRRLKPAPPAPVHTRALRPDEPR